MMHTNHIPVTGKGRPLARSGLSVKLYRRLSQGIPTIGRGIRVGISGDLECTMKKPLAIKQRKANSRPNLKSILRERMKSALARCARGRLGFFKIVRFEVVLFQQVVKIGSIFAGQLRGLAYVAIGHRKHLHQIVSFEGIAGIF